MYKSAFLEFSHHLWEYHGRYYSHTNQQFLEKGSWIARDTWTPVRNHQVATVTLLGRDKY